MKEHSFFYGGDKQLVFSQVLAPLGSVAFIESVSNLYTNPDVAVFIYVIVLQAFVLLHSLTAFSKVF